MKISVYGASSDVIDSVYITAVEKLGNEMGKRGHSLIFGGGASGVMGAAARGMSAQNAEIIGVAPSFFNVDGVLYEGCTDFIYTETMHERKYIMEEKADAFIIAPGGIGTFEEFFEALTLKQLGRHNKPIAIFNVNGYYDEMEALLNKAISGKFMKDSCQALYHFFDDVSLMLDYIESYDHEKMIPEQLKFLK